jgi:hypothetical protein
MCRASKKKSAKGLCCVRNSKEVLGVKEREYLTKSVERRDLSNGIPAGDKHLKKHFERHVLQSVELPYHRALGPRAAFLSGLILLVIVGIAPPSPPLVRLWFLLFSVICDIFLCR